MNRQAFLAHLSIETRTLEVWLEQDWLLPGRSESGEQFSATDVARARLIRQLDEEMGVNDAGIGVILHLLDQLHGVRQALEGLTDSLRREP